jgi:alpha-L-rhamnosidase
VIDFGQNLVGWVMIKAKGNAGDTITISHAEVLDKYGNFYTENLETQKHRQNIFCVVKERKNLNPILLFLGFAI